MLVLWHLYPNLKLPKKTNPSLSFIIKPIKKYILTTWLDVKSDYVRLYGLSFIFK